MPLYKGKKTSQISFPLGGIGTGCIGLGGNGRLMDWEIFNRPNKGSLNGYSHLAVKASDGDRTVDARVLAGDMYCDFAGQHGNGFGFGLAKGTMGGFPHFSSCEFLGEFPVAEISFSDPHFPAAVKLTAFNPLIPLNSGDSSIPAAFFEVGLTNISDRALTYTVNFTAANPFTPSVNRPLEGERGLTGIRMEQPGTNCDLTLVTDCPSASEQLYWYRGGWQDGIATYWREFSTQPSMRRRDYPDAGKKDHCTLSASVDVAPGGSAKVRFVLSWSIPDNFNYWKPYKDENGCDVTWKNWYATKWPDSGSSAVYAMREWDRLFAGTGAFRDALFSSTLDPAVTDAVSSTLSVLKSPTVLRLEDGSLYGWEGCGERRGSCEGSCTHVWNYAYAAAFLFPDLERSMRENDYRYNQFEDGHLCFRMALPPGREKGWDMPCLDGQMGGVIKVFREWKLSGDTEWMRSLFPSVRMALEYAWSADSPLGWDKDRDGLLEGRQHHTLDTELFGPSAWLEGMYLAALKAASGMASALGMNEKAEEYAELFGKGSALTENELFNGSYYIQKIDLKDRDLTERYGAGEYWNPEAGEIKYQIGEGCEIDQLLGQWHASICGLGDIFDRENRRTALKSLFRNNYKKSLREFANPWRLFGLNDESGTVICDYPEGAAKPWIPVPYCEETMHGFEYALAGLMISEGMTEEGLTLIRAVRDRYDGEKRDPYNEIECGSNYARSMASFALVPLFSGFVFDLPRKTVGFRPPAEGELYCPWFCGTAWGTVKIGESSLEMKIIDGRLDVRRIAVGRNDAASVTADGRKIGFSRADGALELDADIPVASSLEVRFGTP